MTLKELAEMICRFDESEGLSPDALWTLKDFAAKALAARTTPASAVPVEYMAAVDAICKIYSPLSASMRIGSERRVAWQRLFDARATYRERGAVTPSPASDVSAPSPSSVGAAIRALLDEHKDVAKARDGDWWRGYGAALHWIGKAIEEMESKA